MASWAINPVGDYWTDGGQRSEKRPKATQNGHVRFVRFYDQNYINRWFVWQCRQSKVSEYDDGARFRKAEKSVGWTGLFALESLH